MLTHLCQPSCWTQWPWWGRSSSLLINYGLFKSPYRQMCALKHILCVDIEQCVHLHAHAHTLILSIALPHTPGLGSTDVCVYVSPESNNIRCHRTAQKPQCCILLPFPPQSFLCLPSLSLSYVLWHFEASPVILPSLTCIQGPISPSNTLQSAHNT